MQKRILIVEFRQETNTFNPVVVEKRVFSKNNVFEGDAVFQSRMSVNTAIRGAVDTFRAAGAEVIPTAFVSAAAISGGKVADDVLEMVMERVRAHLDKN